MQTSTFSIVLSWVTDTLPPVTITGTSSTVNSITVNIGTIPDGVDRVIIGYYRLDLGQPVVGQYVNNNQRDSVTFHSLVPGAKYRITAWGLGGSSNRIRSRSPAVVEVTTKSTQSKITNIKYKIRHDPIAFDNTHFYSSIPNTRPHYHKSLSTWN